MSAVVIRQQPCMQFEDVSDQLVSAFERCKGAIEDGASVTLVVHASDLLGQGSPEDAAVANGFLGLMRAVVFESRSRPWMVNVVAIDAGAQTPVAVIEMLAAAQLTGQVIPTTKSGIGRLVP